MDGTEYASPVTTPSLLSNYTPLLGNETQSPELTCDEYVNYVDELLRGSAPEGSASGAGVDANRTISDAERHYHIISTVVNGYAVPAVCFFGVFGNFLNLVVLTRKRLTRSMKHMERSVNNGLVSLATSDLFLCLVYFVASLYWSKLNYDSLLELFYRTYQEALINFFLLASTWLTVMMAVSRYIAVCHPLHARSFIHQTGTNITIAAVWLGSFAVNL